jgi:hypothetical protein
MEFIHQKRNINDFAPATLVDQRIPPAPTSDKLQSQSAEGAKKDYSQMRLQEYMQIQDRERIAAAATES